MRTMIFITAALAVTLTASAAGAAPRPTDWPSADLQLKVAHVEPGTALEKLILNNQDFGMLRAAEAHDKIPVPLWLRVYWRRAHPEMVYSAADPTGGYPFVLKEVWEWMPAPPDLEPGPPEAAAEVVAAIEAEAAAISMEPVPPAPVLTFPAILDVAPPASS